VCVICADEMEKGVPVMGLCCGHSFHEPCIRRWLTRQHTCPTCRFELEVDDVKYLRSIGLCEEADALEKVEQARQARELQQQTAQRRRWVRSMRQGEPVHFGLVCSGCSSTPLVGECYRCTACDGFILCADCHAGRETRRLERVEGGENSDAHEEPSSEHPWEHEFAPMGMGMGGASGPIVGTGGVPQGPGGLLTVLLPAPSTTRSTSHSDQQVGEEEETPGEAALAAAEAAFVAVRSLALAPLTADSPRIPSPRHDHRSTAFDDARLNATGGGAHRRIG